MSSEGGTWSGDIQKMRKKDLTLIASQMGITLPVGMKNKYDIQDAIRDVLYTDGSVREDPRFVGLFNMTKEGKRSNTYGDLASLSHSSPARSIINTATSAAHTASFSPPGGLTRALDSLESAATQTASALQPAASAAKAYSTAALSSATELAIEKAPTERQIRSLRRSASRGVIKARDSSIDLVGEAQVTLSSGWNIAIALTALEVLFVLYSNIGYELASLGPYRWYLISHETPARFFTVPTLSPLLCTPFLPAFVSYIFTSIWLPLIFGTVLAFPQTPRKHALAPPNAITFSIARLASVLLTGYVFQVEGALEEQEGFPEVAVLGSAVSVALTLLAAFYKK